MGLGKAVWRCEARWRRKGRGVGFYRGRRQHGIWKAIEAATALGRKAAAPKWKGEERKAAARKKGKRCCFGREGEGGEGRGAAADRIRA